MIIPYTFQANTTIEPSQVNDNFIAVNNALQSQDTAIQNYKSQMQQQFNTALANMQALFPVGTLMLWSTATAPDGYIPVIGQSITSYTALAELLGITTLPDSRNKAIWVAAEPLIELGATLPNIKGSHGGGGGVYFSSASGAFTGSGTGSYSQNWYGAPQYGSISFDASNSSNIYQDNATVRPPSITTLLIIKYE